MTKKVGAMLQLGDMIPAWKLQLARNMAENLVPEEGRLFYFASLAKQFEGNPSTVKATFYNFTSKGIPKHVLDEAYRDIPKQDPDSEQIQMHIESEDTTKPEDKNEAPAEPLTKPTTDVPKYYDSKDYPIGTTIEVKVREVQPYGALAYTTDGRETPCIIHIKNARPHYISDIKKWFKEGQTLSAIIFEHQVQRLSLSTRNMPMTELNLQKKPDKLDFADQLKAIRDQLEAPPELTATLPQNGEEIKSPVEIKESIPMTAQDNEWLTAKPYITALVGDITPTAESRLRELMGHGLVKFTIALLNQKAVNVDLGLMLANQIEQSMNPPQQEGL